MEISIITVVYNGSDTIADCLRSISTQTYPCEHIIVDGGSTDRTLDVVKQFSHVKRILSEPDNGIYDAMNKGISLATGEVVGILNSDDIYFDNDVLACVADVFNDSNVDICYADLVYVAKNDTDHVVRRWKSSTYNEELLRKGWIPAHPTFFVRKRIYDIFGGYDLHYTLAADYDLMVRFLVRNRVRPVYLPKVLVKMRLGGATNNSLRNIIRQNYEILTAARKNGVILSPGFLGYKIADRVRQFFQKDGKDS